MRVLFQASLVVVIASALSGCGGASPVASEPVEKVSDTRPEVLVPSKIGWFVSNAGISANDQGMFVDMGDGGSLTRFVRRSVRQQQELELTISLDASGDQSLNVRMSDGCNGVSALSEFESDLYLKNGQNRIAAVHSFDEDVDCFAVHLMASSGSVSFFIEDATIYWKEVDEPSK